MIFVRLKLYCILTHYDRYMDKKVRALASEHSEYSHFVCWLLYDEDGVG